MPWDRELLNKALTLSDTVKKHCNWTFKIWCYLRLSTDQHDQLNSMETQDQQLQISEYSSDWQPSLSGISAKTTPNGEGSPLESLVLQQLWAGSCLQEAPPPGAHPPGQGSISEAQTLGWGGWWRGPWGQEAQLASVPGPVLHSLRMLSSYKLFFKKTTKQKNRKL